MASADNTVDNNNMAIQLYEHPQVGETAAAADSNPTNAVDSTTANPSDSSNTISNNNNNNADSTILVENGGGRISEMRKVEDLASYWTSRGA
ncbi:hypothetical protein CASFOL_005554 [Castilleja foliolosa]|uniref:Uncharacterized protein n=1 Tax=Castilleja foliolosa TaxID=1961234 RepID=A0ABD3E7U8_9LAMI